MGIEIEGLKGIAGGCRAAAKLCGSCKFATAAVFCRVDLAFLCLNCDSRIHDNKLSSPDTSFTGCVRSADIGMPGYQEGISLHIC
ncbi:hypothetical protein SLA2020_046500 [Shorea laevis]